MRYLGRALREALAHPPGDGSPSPSLDLSGMVLDPPRMRECVVAETGRMEAIAVPGPVVGFSAFLDGVQQSHVVDYAGTVPIVAGRTAAVVRVRVDRRMTTWGDGPRAQCRLYAPCQRLSANAIRDIEAAGLELRDTLPPAEETSGHPMELLRRAVDAVKDDREHLERDLAESWVERSEGVLFVDGGLPFGQKASVASTCVGVVKSHHTIYTPSDGLGTVLGLGEGERTSAFVIERTWGPRVLSWYLRLREPPSHDPFMGLVRVEVARADELLGDATTLARRADEVSQWILAERAPLSLPDARWDRMVYGIRDCEEYLRATAG